MFEIGGDAINWVLKGKGKTGLYKDILVSRGPEGPDQVRVTATTGSSIRSLIFQDIDAQHFPDGYSIARVYKSDTAVCLEVTEEQPNHGNIDVITRLLEDPCNKLFSERSMSDLMAHTEFYHQIKVETNLSIDPVLYKDLMKLKSKPLWDIYNYMGTAIRLVSGNLTLVVLPFKLKGETRWERC